MTDDSTVSSQSVAIEQLEAFGFSTYASRTFVGLSQLETATAKEISQIADVPRTRVYDAIEELQTRGLIDIEQTTPRQFTALSPARASHRLRDEAHDRAAVLTAALSQLTEHHETHR